MTRTRGEPPRRHAGPLPMECDYGKKLNGRCPADSPRLPSHNESETSATERQRGGKHAYTQEKPARNVPEMRACSAMNAMGSLSRPSHAAPARGKVDSPLFAVHAHEPTASGAGIGACGSDASGAGAGACGSDTFGAGAGGQQTGRPGRGRRRLWIRRPRRRRRQTGRLPQHRRRRRRLQIRRPRRRRRRR